MAEPKAAKTRAEIYAFINKRYKERMKEKGRDRPAEVLWAESVRRYDERCRNALRMQWFTYHSQQAKRHRALSNSIIRYHEAQARKYAAALGISPNGHHGGNPPEPEEVA